MFFPPFCKTHLPAGFLFGALFLSPNVRAPLTAHGEEKPDQIETKINLVIGDFSRRLGITQSVVVSIVAENSRLASVEHAAGGTGSFRMSFAAGFVRTLNDGELRAAIAHEMGHVWIYTHFPYLQTETLANQQALKLVPREDLERVYEKVWEWNGEKGSLAHAMACVEEAVAVSRRQAVLPARQDAAEKQPEPAVAGAPNM